MDIEQLKLILETVKSTTGDAKTIAVAWLFVETIPAILTTGGIVFGLTFALRAAKELIPLCTSSDLSDTACVTELRKRLIPDKAWGSITPYERRVILDWVGVNYEGDSVK